MLPTLPEGKMSLKSFSTNSRTSLRRTICTIGRPGELTALLEGGQFVARTPTLHSHTGLAALQLRNSSRREYDELIELAFPRQDLTVSTRT